MSFRTTLSRRFYYRRMQMRFIIVVKHFAWWWAQLGCSHFILSSNFMMWYVIRTLFCAHWKVFPSKYCILLRIFHLKTFIGCNIATHNNVHLCMLTQTKYFTIHVLCSFSLHKIWNFIHSHSCCCPSFFLKAQLNDKLLNIMCNSTSISAHNLTSVRSFFIQNIQHSMYFLRNVSILCVCMWI